MVHKNTENPGVYAAHGGIAMAAGAIIITLLELIVGTIVNIILGWNVWDYSNLPGNLLAVAVYLDDWIRYLLWGEKRPKYKF